jgi:predicted Zn-dependent protease
MPRAMKRGALWIAAFALSLAGWIGGGAAQAQGLIRDAGLEQALRRIAAPVLTAAGLPTSRVRVMLINDPSMNAFVADGSHIFIHTGLLLRLSNAAELQAVLAHEAAHIANGHIARRISNLRGAASGSRLGLLLALAAGVAGAPADAVAGIAAGTTGSAQRIFLAHTRGEEAAADQSGVSYMARAQVDPQAMLDVLDLFRGQEALAPGRQDPYVRSHPLSRDRLRALRGNIAAQPQVVSRSDPQIEYWFARARAKTEAFLQNPSMVLRKVSGDDRSDATLIRLAVANHRLSRTDEALRAVDALVARNPKDAYAVELRAQILLESRRFAPAAEAYGRAAALAPNEPLILAGHGRALLALDTRDSNRRALQVLERAQSRDGADPRMLRDLAVAYAKAGQNGMASVVTAERYALQGRFQDAAVHANRAVGALPRGSPGWMRAQDVLVAAENVQ